MRLDGLAPWMSCLVGILIIYGLKYFRLWLAQTIHRVMNPPAGPPATVWRWTYCRMGDHVVRTDSVAWQDEQFICAACVHDREGTR